MKHLKDPSGFESKGKAERAFGRSFPARGQCFRECVRAECARADVCVQSVCSHARVPALRSALEEQGGRWHIEPRRCRPSALGTVLALGFPLQRAAPPTTSLADCASPARCDAVGTCAPCLLALHFSLRCSARRRRGPALTARVSAAGGHRPARPLQSRACRRLGGARRGRPGVEAPQGRSQPPPGPALPAHPALGACQRRESLHFLPQSGSHSHFSPLTSVEINIFTYLQNVSFLPLFGCKK